MCIFFTQQGCHGFDFGAYASANAAIALQCIILELVTVFTALLDDSEAPRPVKLASTAVHLKRTRILMLVNLVPLKYLSKSVYFKNNSLKTNTTSFFIVFDVV